MAPRYPRKPLAKRLFKGMAGSPLSGVASAEIAASEPTLVEIPAVETPNVVTTPCSKGCGASITLPADDVSADFKFTCANCAPQNKRANAVLKATADGPAIQRTAIPREVRQRIEQSLSPLPNTLSEQKSAPIEVETSEGLVSIESREQAEDQVDADDIGSDKAIVDSDEVIGTKFAPKIPKLNFDRPERPSVQPVGSTTKVPRYLKSVPQPLVPSGNSKAPWGYDENNNPIGVPTPKDSLVPTNLNRPVGPAEPHKYAGSKVKTDVLQPVDGWGRYTPTTSQSEATLRRLFGEKISDDMVVKPSKHHADFVDYTKMFGLSRTELVDLLNVQVDTERIEDVLDTTQPKQRILKSPVPVKVEVNRLESAIADAAKRVAEVKTEIEASEQLVDSWSVRVMKAQVKRGERQPDDILDKTTREKFKREERIKVNKLEGERHDLRQQLNEGKQKLAIEQERLSTWGSREEDYTLEYPRVTRENAIFFSDKFVPPNRDEFKGVLPLGYEYGVDGYAQVVHEFGGECRTSGEDTLFRHWRQFENELVLQAIGWGLIQPSLALLKKHPTLTTYIDRDAVEVNTLDDAESTDHDSEDVLIIKTGGAAVNGQIYGAGRRWNGKQKALYSFDAPVGRGRFGEGAGNSDREPYVPDLGDDRDAYQPD